MVWFFVIGGLLLTFLLLSVVYGIVYLAIENKTESGAPNWMDTVADRLGFLCIIDFAILILWLVVFIWFAALRIVKVS